MPSDVCRVENSASRLGIAWQEVHVWLICLSLPWSKVGQLKSALSPDEKTRADRFRSPVDRMRFVIAHGVKRIILGSYINVEPRDLRFGCNRYGKPVLLGQIDPYQIHFNLSHSYDIALLAVTLGLRVGVDIEFYGEANVDDLLTPEVFSQKEMEVLHRLPATERRQAFYNCWTKKEALAKAIGYGLAHPFQLPEFPIAPEQSADLVTMPWTQRDAHCWSLRSLNIAEAYVGALAVEGHEWELRFLIHDSEDWAAHVSTCAQWKTFGLQFEGRVWAPVRGESAYAECAIGQ